MSDLSFSARIVSGGATTELEQAPFSLEATTRAEISVGLREHKVDSPYVEGEYTVHAVRTNVVEAINVFVETTSPQGVQGLVEQLLEAFTRSQYLLQWDWHTTGNQARRETWRCFAAQGRVECSQPLMVAKMALVRLQVPRLPSKTFATVTF